MGKVSKKKLVVISIVFGLTCLFVFVHDMQNQAIKKQPINLFFGKVDGYVLNTPLNLEHKAVEMLDLDDYYYANYKNSGQSVSLYVGYYYSAKKAYSAHSPLVCYPSQGWKVDKGPIKRKIQINGSKINCEEIIASYGNNKELVIYWYQAGEFTNTQVYRNKIDIGYNKFFKNQEQHGFIRVSVPFDSGSYHKAYKAAEDFIRAFYPNLIDYIEKGNVTHI